jgi:GR25 family glycosyltransferase involved in LPS biosynthesis
MTEVQKGGIQKTKYNIFVINICEERWKKYKDDPRYARWQGWNGKEELDLEWINENYHFYWNCNNDLRHNVAGCSESHLSLIKHIRDYKINNAIIIEDDAMIDFEALEYLSLDRMCSNEILFVGGMFHPPVLKNLKTFVPPKYDKNIYSINTINPKQFLITNCHGYYIPKWELAEQLLVKKGKKRRALDAETKHLQRARVLTKFLYPAISILNMEDAKKGFTWSKYKLKDDLKYY